MPRMDSAENEAQGDDKSLVKLLLIGDGRLGKTWYAGMAAASGFNVLYMDGDVARATIRKLPLEVRSRIFLMDIRDTYDGGQRDHRMWDTVKEFTSSTRFLWNDTEQRLWKRGDVGEMWEIKPAKMDSSCVLIFDSWTSFIESITLAAAIEHSVDLETATTSQMRPVYQMGAIKATMMLQMIRSARCHVIVLAHPDEYTHTTKPEGKKAKDIKEPDLIVDWTKMIPRSTSKPHGMQLPKYFTDCAWMDVNPAGTERVLDFRLKPDRVAGGHFDGRKNVDDYSFENLIKAIGGRIPGAGQPNPYDHWLRIVTAEEGATAAAAAPEATPVLDGRVSAPVKGMAGFMKKAG